MITMNGFSIYILCGIIYSFFTKKALISCYNMTCSLYVKEKLKEKKYLTKNDYLKLKFLVMFVMLWRVLIFPIPLSIRIYYFLIDNIFKKN